MSMYWLRSGEYEVHTNSWLLLNFPTYTFVSMGAQQIEEHTPLHLFMNRAGQRNEARPVEQISVSVQVRVIWIFER